MTQATSHRIILRDERNPRGPDGQGWNRVAINTLSPTARCSRQPLYRQAALDTLRGMAPWGVPTAYAVCQGPLDCSTCARVTKTRAPWLVNWQLREDRDGVLSISLPGMPEAIATYKNWAELLDLVDAPMLKRVVHGSDLSWIAA